MGASRTYENDDSEAAASIDKYITCSIPNEKECPALSKLANKVQQHRHTCTCIKKKVVTCRFITPWSPSDETSIVHNTNVSEEKLNRNKEILDRVLSEVIMTDDDDTTLTKVLDNFGVTEDVYIHALETMTRKIVIICGRKPNEMMISPYYTVLLNLMKYNMNL